MSIFYAILQITIVAFVIIVSSSMMVFVGYAQSNQTSNQTSTYENKTEGIRFQYPSDWGNLSLQGGCINHDCGLPMNAYYEDFTHYFTIMKLFNDSSQLEPNCNCKTLKEFVTKSYKAFQNQIHNFTFLNDNQTTVGKKYPGWQYEIAGSAENRPLEQSQNEYPKNHPILAIDTKGNDAFYEFTLQTFNETDRLKILPEFRKLVDSVEFFPPNRPVPKIPSFLDINDTQQQFKPDRTAESKSNGIELLSDNSFTDSVGYFHVVGEVKNNSPNSVRFVKIIGTFYDSSNQVVATDFTYTNPTNIDSGGTAPFEIILSSASIPISQISNYKLTGTYD